jgi:hypothetical protein
MRAESWFDKFWTRLRVGVVQDVPPSLEECECCREVDCTQERWLKCERRLAGETASLLGLGAALPAGRTGEAPGVSTTQESQAVPEERQEREEPGDQGRSRKISSD